MLVINQSKQIYIVPYVTRESEVHRQRLGQVFTFTVNKLKMFGFQITSKSAK